MEKVNSTVAVYAQILTFIAIWALIVVGTGGVSSSDPVLIAIQRIPVAITLYVLVGIVFAKWVWRWEPLQGWLIKIPDIQGTWEGELRSDWVNPETGAGIAPIRVLLVVRQSFSSIKCTLMTPESSSYSTSADINVVYGGDELFLTYTYTNRPKAMVRDRSQIHDGAAILKIVRSPGRSLEGEYWTSRKTRGEMSFRYRSKRLMEKYS